MTVSSGDTREDLATIDMMDGVEEMDHAAEDDGSLDVWGVYQGDDFRLRLVSAE